MSKEAMKHLDEAAWAHSTLILFGQIKAQMEGGNIRGNVASKAASQIIKICDRVMARSLDLFDAEAAAAISRAEADALTGAA